MFERLDPHVGVRRLGRLVPGPAAAGVHCLQANNNLDLARHGGRLWLAWRTAPSHFASALARIEVSSIDDSADPIIGPWRHEVTLEVGADLREPRLISDGNRLHLFAMELGTDPKRFQPRRTLRTALDPSGWTDPVTAIDDTIVPWRIRRLRGRWALLTYRGAERMYSARPADPEVEIRWSDDLVVWSTPEVIHVGGTECELVEIDDRFIGVTRNEGPGRFGSDVLVGTDLGSLHVTPVKRKLDSPNLVVWNGEPWLFARRSMANEGAYDVAPAWLPGAVRIRVNQAIWSTTRKRSAIYRIDPITGTVRWEADLASGGDTAFAAVVPDGSDLLVADYRSPDGDPRWIRGQLRPTVIDLHRVTWG